MTGTQESPRLRELVQRAAADPAFAEQLLTEPERVASEYELTSAQVDKIRELAGAGLLQPAVQAHAKPPPDPIQGGGYY
jgi:hypothetical protein